MTAFVARRCTGLLLTLLAASLVVFLVLQVLPGDPATLMLDTSARPDSQEQTERRRALIKLAQTGKFKGVTPRLLPLLIHPARLDDRALTGTVMAMAERVGQGAFLRQQHAILNRPDGRPDLPSIVCPALVVCGRNEPLREKLEELSASLPTPMTVLGFTNKIPEYFHAVVLLVTKAGPGSLAEANAAQLPVVVYDYVPGQERGNVDFVRNHGLGAVALHGAAEVVQATRTLIRTPHRLDEIRRNQEIVAPERSSRRIAALIAQIANTGTIPAQDGRMPTGLRAVASL